MESHSNRTILFAFISLLTLILCGVTGFMYLENYSFTEAFFMTIITISTVGFREIRTLSYEGMWFTIALIILSLGLFAFAVSIITKYFYLQLFSVYDVKKKMEKRISKLRNHVIVVGYGRNGSQAVDELLLNNIPVVVIENRPKVIDYIRENPKIIFIEGDATDDMVLHKAGIENAQALISALANDADNLFVVITAREINPDLVIISRASAIANDRKLKLAGATNVIMPDKVGGQKMAILVIQPDINEFIEKIMLPQVGDVSLYEISCSGISPNNIKTIGELQIREKTGVSILGIKHEDGQYTLNPSSETVLKKGIMLFVLGNKKQVQLLKSILTD